MSGNGNKIVDLRSLSCPFAAGVAVTPQGQCATIMPPCAKEKCAVWDAVTGMCSVLSMSGSANDIVHALSAIRVELSNIRMELSPPKDSPSPAMRMANAFEAMLKLQETKKG